MSQKNWSEGSLFKGSPIFFWGSKEGRTAAYFKSNQLPIIPRAWTLIFHIHQVNRRKRRARESALPTNFEQSKEKNYPPTSLVTLLCIFCVLGRAHSCALCAPSGRRGESRRAGDGNPALLLLCSNRPQQPARQRRVAIFRRESFSLDFWENPDLGKKARRVVSGVLQAACSYTSAACRVL